MSFRYRHGDRPLDGYTIKRGVGHGGFGEVYYAVSDGGREVALKTILQNHEIELRGVRHCINLKSPHLVSIFDVRSGEDGSPFVIMEYVSGPSLRDLLREHPNGMGQDKAAYLVREIGRGLAYLHNQGIVHRDLKPENIFYEDGYVKIGDYGLSKYISVSRQSGQTMSVGTVHYMAPEIGSGIYNQGIDIYALGIMTYELLTGKVPFTGDSFGEILMKHLTAKPELGDVGEPFHSVISKALEKKPEDRYRTVEDMVSELFQSGQLNDGLVGFNPASLSMVGRTAAGPSAAVSPPLAGASPPPAAASPPPVGDSGGSGGSPPPLPLATAPTAAGSPPPVVGPPPARGRAGTPGAAAPPGDPHGPPPAGGQPGRRPPGPAGAKSPVSLGYGEAEATDPLDQGQRLVRAVFISLAVAAAVLILSGGRGGLAIRGLVGFFFTVFSGAAAILVTEFNFASRFRIDAGMPRRVVAAFLALIPMVIGSAVYGSGRNHSLIVLGFLASLLVINWRERLDPYRAERISVGQALLAGLVGFLFSALFPHGHFLLGAGGFLVISLLVNALSPFVPYHLRREIMEQKGHAGAGRVAAQGLPPGVAAAAPGGVGAPAERPAAAPPPPRPAVPPRLRPQPTPPGSAARVFWSLVAAGLLACGLSCYAGVAYSGSYDRLPFLACGTAALCYAGFALYRGVWARRMGFWGRSVRPFLLFSALGGVAVPAAMLLGGEVMEGVRWSPRDNGPAVIMLAFSLVFGGFVLAFDRLVRFSGDHGIDAARLPWTQRPVHPFIRFVLLLLGACGIATALSLLLVVLLESISERDQGPMLLGAAGSVVAASFFVRQGLRRRRGSLWQGWLRPLFLFASVGVLTVCSLAVSTAEDLRGDEELMLVVGSIFAAVFGAFAFFLGVRRDDDGAPRFRSSPAGDPAPGGGGGADASARRVHNGFAGLGMILWMVGLLAMLWAVAVGAATSVWDPLTGLEPGELRLTGAVLCLLGAGSILGSRLQAGFLHLARGAFGQLALLGAMGCFALVSSNVGFEGGSVVEFDLASMKLAPATVGIFLLTLLGALFVVWPPASEATPRRVEPDAAAARISSPNLS